jgi:hypothetical protein
MDLLVMMLVVLTVAWAVSGLLFLVRELRWRVRWQLRKRKLRQQFDAKLLG